MNTQQPILTMKWLTRPPHRACDEALRAFMQRWPDGTAPLSEVLLALADHPLGLDWWNWLISQRSRLFTSVVRQYRVTILSEDEQYKTNLQFLEDQYWNALYSFNGQNKVDRKAIWDKYWEARSPLDDKYMTDYREILRKLAWQLEEEVV